MHLLSASLHSTIESEREVKSAEATRQPEASNLHLFVTPQNIGECR